MWRAGQDDEALRIAEEAAGLELSGGERLRSSAEERATALTVIGRIHESRGRRSLARESYENAIEVQPFSVEALLGAGRVLLGERRYRDASSRFDAVINAVTDPLQSAPGDAQPYTVQARIGAVRAILPLGLVQDARERMQTLAQERPQDQIVRTWHGKTLEALELSEEAIAEYRAAIAIDVTKFDPYLALAKHYHDTERPDEAAATFEEAREHVEPDAYFHQMLGESELKRNRISSARQNFERALELDAESTGGLFGLGVVLRKQNQITAASERFEQLAALDPGYPGLSLERGRIFESQGRADQAVQSYQRALETSPDDLDLVVRLGAAQVAAGLIDEAEENIASVMRRRADMPEAEHYMGRVTLLKGRLPAAVQHLGRATQLDPERPEYHLFLAKAQLESNNLSRALEAIEKSIDLDDTIGDAFWIRGRILLRTAAVRDAIRDLERALELSPNRFEAHADMAECYQQLGKRREAIRAYEQAVAGAPDRGAYWYRLGKARLDRGDRREALAALSRATTLGDAEESPPAWLYEAHRVRAECHKLGGDRGPATTHFQRYLELSPSSAIDRADVLAQLRSWGVEVEDDDRRR